MLTTIITRDLKLAFNNVSQFFNPIIFFFITITIFAILANHFEFANQLNYQILVIWFCLIFAIILGISNFLKEDFSDGSLEQLVIQPHLFSLIILARVISNWLIYCLPLIIFIPLAAIILRIEFNLLQNLISLTIIVSLLINFIACFCASLTISSNKNESLLTILILPLIVPIIIFANSAFIDLDHNNFVNSLFFLILIFTFLSPILILLSSLAVKISLKN